MDLNKNEIRTPLQAFEIVEPVQKAKWKMPELSIIDVIIVTSVAILIALMAFTVPSLIDNAKNISTKNNETQLIPSSTRE